MADWNELVVTALNNLGADEKATRGAILRDEVESLAIQEGNNLQEYLNASSIKFGQLVTSTPGVSVRKLPGTDMFVGLSSIVISDEELRKTNIRHEQHRIRPDLFEAFTRADSHFYYEPNLDRFVDSPVSFSVIETPMITFKTLLDRRRRYAKQVGGVVGIRLENSFTAASDPEALTNFTAAVRDSDLAGDWHEFNVKLIREEVVEWASNNSLSVSPNWFQSRAVRSRTQSPQQTLRLVSRFMTDDEVREISLPFRAVEEMLDELSRRRQS